MRGFVNFASLMGEEYTIQTALISVYNKDGLSELLKILSEKGCKFISTGGTATFIRNLGYEVEDVSEISGYPEILGGRVKTLHPAIFGGILVRSENEHDLSEMAVHRIRKIDLVVVDLYPFQETLNSGAQEMEIIEKIDIGGISLIRAAAKNFHHTGVISDRGQYAKVASWLDHQGATLSLEQRKSLAFEAFARSSSYDSSIMEYFAGSYPPPVLNLRKEHRSVLRYGENPHQRGWFYGEQGRCFRQVSGKEISYNNFLDIDAGFSLISEFTEQSPTFLIIKHNNACGAASDADALSAWQKALACDPLSAFGGVIVTQTKIDDQLAKEIDKIFFEIIISPEYSKEALDILKKKSNRIILQIERLPTSRFQFRSCLNGILLQETDLATEDKSAFKTVTQKSPDESALEDLTFALKICKHSKSNTIILAKDQQMRGAGAGLTSRIDALRLALERARNFGLSTEGGVMASDAFFPFPDCVEIAASGGIRHIVQPGGSIKDKDSIEAADRLGLSMVFTGIRHFKH